MDAKTWNEKYPVGTAVVVRRDNGDELHTTTRSEAWTLDSGHDVVKVHGIAGGYKLDRVKPDVKKNLSPRPSLKGKGAMRKAGVL